MSTQIRIVRSVKGPNGSSSNSSYPLVSPAEHGVHDADDRRQLEWLAQQCGIHAIAAWATALSGSELMMTAGMLLFTGSCFMVLSIVGPSIIGIMKSTMTRSGAFAEPFQSLSSIDCHDHFVAGVGQCGLDDFGNAKFVVDHQDERHPTPHRQS